jgi:hypothetical protein
LQELSNLRNFKAWIKRLEDTGRKSYRDLFESHLEDRLREVKEEIDAELETLQDLIDGSYEEE